MVSEFNENDSHVTSNEDRVYSNEVIIDALKIGWHGTGKDKDEIKEFASRQTHGDPWKSSRSILDEEKIENERTKRLIKLFMSKEILCKKQFST